MSQSKEARPTPKLKFPETHPAQGQVCEIPLILEGILGKLLGFPVIFDKCKWTENIFKIFWFLHK